MIRRSTTIYDLNFSSFQHILSYLRHFDKLRLLLATECVAMFAEENIDSEPFDLSNIQANFSVEEIEQLLTNYGSCIKRLRHTKWLSDETTLDYMQLLRKHCTNLEEIYFSNIELTTTNIYGQILYSARKTIEKLTLENCTLKTPAFWLIINLSVLKVISLQCSKRSGQEFGRLDNLNDLNLDVLLKIQPNLKELTIYDSFFSREHPQICAMKSFREISMLECFEKSVVKYLKDLFDNRVRVESLEIKMPVCFPNMRDTLKSEIVDQIIKLDNLRVLSFRNSEFFEDSHLVTISKFCRKVEMLDLYRASFSDSGIIGCVEHLNDLRHLDVSYCNVTKNLYSRLVKIRKELGFTQELFVYIQPKMELRAILQSDEYIDAIAFVQLTLISMRSIKDSSILECLEQLNQEPSLLALDDYCLHHIMQFLPLVDQLILGLTNTHFDTIIIRFLRISLFKIADVVANFTVQEARILLPRLGKIVKNLHITGPSFDFEAEYYDLTAQYFTNVVELHCYDDILSEKKLRSADVQLCRQIIIKSWDSLQAVHINYQEIDDEFCLEISKATELRALNLKSSTLTGVNLGNLTNLTSLNLSYVKDLQSTSFIAICKSNRLKSLNIVGCETLNNQSILVLVETQCNLEALAIGGDYAATNMNLIGRLKNLKDLTMRNLSQNRLLELIGALAELKCDQLQFFFSVVTPPFNPYSFDATECSRISENFAKLRNLVYLAIPENWGININFLKTIAYGCPILKALDLKYAANLTDEEVLGAIRLFKHLRHIDVHDCRISSLIMIYIDALKIKMNESIRGPLVLYGDTRHELIIDLMKSPDYAINKKYVKLSCERLCDLDKYELFKN